jgi:hypothetical protein
VRNFSFNLVADQAKFRESNGILFLLRMLHSSSHDRAFQVSLAEIVRNQFAPIEENKRAISKILEDPQIISRFFAVEESHVLPKSGSAHSLEGHDGSPPPSPRPRTVEQPASSSSSSALGSNQTQPVAQQGVLLGMEGFLSWYYSTDPDMVLKRTAIEQRIEKIASPLINLSMKNREKVTGRRNKRIKSLRDKQLRNSVILNKSLTETKSKSSTRLLKFSTSYQQLQDALKLSRQERLKVGEESWKKVAALAQEKYPILTVS